MSISLFRKAKFLSPAILSLLRPMSSLLAHRESIYHRPRESRQGAVVHVLEIKMTAAFELINISTSEIAIHECLIVFKPLVSLALLTFENSLQI